MTGKLALFGGKPIRSKPINFVVPGGTMIGKEEEKQVLEVIRSKSLFRYPGYVPGFLGKVNQFEQAFAAKLGAKYCLAVSSGTAALRVGLAGMGIGPGDEVIMPAWTFVASAGAIVINGAIPIFAEVDKSLNLDPEDFEKKITRQTRAVMVVPILGVSGRIDEIVKIARKHKIRVIEDVASSCGVRYKGKYCGTFGDVGTFSFQMAKVMTTGDGGAIITNNKDIYARAVRYHDQGGFRKHDDWGKPFIGENYRMNELTGAVALAQLRKLDTIISRMRNLKKIIKDGIRDLDGIEFREVPDEKGDIGHSLFMFFKTPEISGRFIKAMQAENVGHAGHIRGVVYELWPWLGRQKTVNAKGCPFTCPYNKRKVHYGMGTCPQTEALSRRGASLYISPIFTEKYAQDVVRGVRKVFGYALTGKKH